MSSHVARSRTAQRERGKHAVIIAGQKTIRVRENELLKRFEQSNSAIQTEFNRVYPLTLAALAVHKWMRNGHPHHWWPLCHPEHMQTIAAFVRQISLSVDGSPCPEA